MIEQIIDDVNRALDNEAYQIFVVKPNTQKQQLVKDTSIGMMNILVSLNNVHVNIVKKCKCRI